MFLRRVAVLVVVPLACLSSPARGAVTAWTDVVVRVYDAGGVLAGTNRQALDQARKTLEAASIDVIWTMCPANPACTEVMKPGELTLRIVRSTAAPLDSRALPLGDAHIDTRTRTGVLATIYIDRVERLANLAGADMRALLGRTIAHELGHLMLATTTHGPVGLMRAFWSQDEVRRGQPRDWSFAPAELAALRGRADARRQAADRAWGTR